MKAANISVIRCRARSERSCDREALHQQRLSFCGSAVRRVMNDVTIVRWTRFQNHFRSDSHQLRIRHFGLRLESVKCSFESNGSKSSSIFFPDTDKKVGHDICGRQFPETDKVGAAIHAGDCSLNLRALRSPSTIPQGNLHNTATCAQPHVKTTCSTTCIPPEYKASLNVTHARNLRLSLVMNPS